jgi:hypothetical protein
MAGLAIEIETKRLTVGEQARKSDVALREDKLSAGGQGRFDSVDKKV